MNEYIKRGLLVGIMVLAGDGCRVKSYESYKAAITPMRNDAPATGDPYMNAGRAAATGGLDTKTTYPTDSPGAATIVLGVGSAKSNPAGGTAVPSSSPAPRVRAGTAGTTPRHQ